LKQRAYVHTVQNQRHNGKILKPSVVLLLIRHFFSDHANLGRTHIGGQEEGIEYIGAAGFRDFDLLSS
jgi:hypothetical protein